MEVARDGDVPETTPPGVSGEADAASARSADVGVTIGGGALETAPSGVEETTSPSVSGEDDAVSARLVDADGARDLGITTPRDLGITTPSGIDILHGGFDAKRPPAGPVDVDDGGVDTARG